MQKRRNSIALAMELRLFCIKPSVYIVSFAVYGFMIYGTWQAYSEHTFFKFPGSHNKDTWWENTHLSTYFVWLTRIIYHTNVSIKIHHLVNTR